MSAQDVPVTEYYRSGTGNFAIALGGESLWDASTSGSFTVDVNACSSGSPTIDKVYATYYTRWRSNGGDNTVPTFDNIVNVVVNGNSQSFNATTASGSTTFVADLDAGSSRTYYRNFGIIDVTSHFAANFNAGTNSITISGLDLPSENADNKENYGVGLTVIYECSNFPLNEAVVMAGNDFFWEGTTRDYQGEYSDIACVNLPTMPDAGQTVDISGILGGQANTSSPFRGNRLYYLTGSGVQPTDTPLQPTGVLVNNGSSVEVGTPNSIWVSNVGREWDAYTGGSANINTGDTWVCVQAHSTQSNGSDSGISGDLLAPSFLLPVSAPACALSIDQTSQSTCQDNGTNMNPADDYFTVTVNASATDGGASNQYQVVIGAAGDGTGGTVLGAQTYGSSITVGDGTNGATGTFDADGSTTYTITVRDADDPMCHDEFTTTAVNSCSTSGGGTLPCATPTAYTMNWLDYPQFNETPTTTYPYVQTVNGVDGSTVDITVTVPEAGNDDNRVGPGSTTFGWMDDYVPTDHTYRFWREDDPTVVTLTYDFSEDVALGNFIFGGQRIQYAGTFAYAEVTFWDGPNGTGNKVVSPLDGGVVTFFNEGDPLNSSININDDAFDQESFLSTENSYVGIGYGANFTGERPWTVLQMDGAVVRSITWSIFASSVDISSRGTNSQNPTEAKNNIAQSGNVSVYLSSFEFEACDATACALALGTPALGTCSYDMTNNRSEATVSIPISWTSPPTGEMISVELQSGTVLSTNPVMIDPSLFPGGSTTVTFDVLADGTGPHTIQAQFATTTSCQDSEPVTFPDACCPANVSQICDDGSTTATLTADPGLTNIIWYNSSDVQVGTGSTLIVDATVAPFSTDLADGTEDYYYIADDASTCPGQLCCPVTIETTTCAVCMLTGAGETLEACNNNSTPANPADDYITFSLNPTGTNTTTYTVTADNGGIVTLAGGGAAVGISYGAPTAFRLQNGSADGSTTYTITITDDADPTCVTTTTVMQDPCDTPVSIGSTVFVDANDNAMQDFGESGIPNVTVELLYDANDNGVIDGAETTPIASTMTDPNGDYFFGGLAPGNYVVQIPATEFGSGQDLENLSASSTDIATSTGDNQTDGDDNGLQPGGDGTVVQSPVIALSNDGERTDVTGESGQGNMQDNADDDNGDMSVDFGFVPEVSIGSTVFVDANDNAMQDFGESGIPDVTVQLLYDANDNGVIDGAETVPVTSTMTDPNGDYFFGGLAPGNYVVQIPATEFGSGQDLENLSASSTDIATSTADNQTDGDDNGLQPGGDGTVVQSPVIALSNDGERTDVTGESGQGNTQDNADDDNGDMSVDFGFVPEVSIGSTVFVDANDNAMQDFGESGIPDVTVQLLYDANDNGVIDGAETTPIASTMTDPNGDYFFGGLAPGNYVVQIPATEFGSGQDLENLSASSTDIATTAADNQTDGDDNGLQPGGDGTVVQSPVIALSNDGERTDVTGESGQGNTQDNADDDNGDMSVDFGFVPEVSIGSTVFVDANDNAMQDFGENGMPNVTVELLYDANDNGVIDGAETTPIASTMTDPNGDYFFGGLAPGNYVVQIPATEFGSGQDLENLPQSSTDIATTPFDNQTDNDDNGLQPGGDGTVVQSPIIALSNDGERTNTTGEVGQGNTQDDTDDDNGDMTVDFGFTEPFELELDKNFISATQQADLSWDVVYEITVSNSTIASGIYDLTDIPAFDDDIAINSAGYTTDAPTNGGNPGPLALAGAGAWLLADDQPMAANTTHTYILTINATLDLSTSSGGDNNYTACGEIINTNNPEPGEALYNRAELDTDSDGSTDDTAEACGDLPYITHNKDMVMVTGPNADGTYTVMYMVEVQNLGGAAGTYDLVDTPNFDDDITIEAADYTTTNVVPSIAGGALSLINSDPNTLADDINIAAGATQTYKLTYIVRLDLSATSTDGGDNLYTSCGTTTATPGPTTADASVPGQGLYNSTTLDVNNDGNPDEEDEICEDLPLITHDKSGPIVGAQNANGSYDVTYTITVQNLGGAATTYDLNDTPAFDDDIVINNALFTTDAPGNPGGALLTANGLANGLADGQNILPGGVHTYTLNYNVTLDLAPGSTDGGDNAYSACEDGTPGDPTTGEGLYNMSELLTDDGQLLEEDEVCGDLPFITHDKEGPVISVQQPDGSYNVTYTVTVRNLGGENGSYGLIDTPDFDDDISINNAFYDRVIQPSGSTFGASLPGSGPWSLASNQIIGGGGVHTYTIVVNVTLNLTDGGADGGDELYTECGNTNGSNNPQPGEGLFNMTSLDTDGDGNPDEEDEVCGDLPYITHNKDMMMVTGPNADGTYTVMYMVEVQNLGGTAGTYDLVDTPNFDDDITIEAADYTTTNVVPSVAGGALSLINSDPNTLADDINIAAGATQTYKLTYIVRLDLSATSTDGGDNLYTSCGTTTATPGPTTADASVPGQGLYNSTTLDTNNDGTPEEEDEICGDLPFITHEKVLVSISDAQPDGSYNVVYAVTVQNFGGATDNYDLIDTPTFDDDIVINSGTLNTTNVVPAIGGGALVTTNGDPNTLADGISIDPGVTQIYTLSYNVSLLLSPASTDGGDNAYTACEDGTPGDPATGEGLYNMSALYSDDGILLEEDEVCGDLPLYSLGNQVWYDTDNNSLRDVSEAGIDGVAVELYSVDPNTSARTLYATQTTTDGGYYLFDNLPTGYYEVDIASSNFQPGGVLEGYYSSGSVLNGPANIDDPNDDVDNDSNGETIGRTVFDIGPTGSISSGVILLGQAPSTPEPTGEPVTPGHPDSTPDDQANYTIDFGFYTQSLGTLVWLDENDNGLADFSEVGIPAVPVQLYTIGFGGIVEEVPVGSDGIWGTADDMLGGIVTDGTGEYLFEGLPAGTYFVVITPPSDYASSVGTGLDGSIAGPYESAPDPDDNIDNDDNGTEEVLPAGAGTLPGAIISELVVLIPGDNGAANNNIVDNGAGQTTNPTVDFGLFQTIFDLALVKELGAGQSNMVSPGDDVTFTIIITNQGGIAADNIAVMDYVPAGFTFNAALNTGWTVVPGGASTTLSIAGGSLPTGGLSPGASAMVDVVLTVNGGLSSGTQLVNFAEISDATDSENNPVQDIDSTPDDTNGNDAGGGVNTGSDDTIGGDGTGSPGDMDPATDEDDHDPEDVVINPFDLALIKELAAGQSAMVSPGDDVRFTITITNQGLIPA
ncbi:MAG: DUF11 domain-containing protein, partial [Phaeodactylibacter sp.]|nr:DUF11 domain-containing protein [Phaeodactylibacter sp.]